MRLKQVVITLLVLIFAYSVVFGANNLHQLLNNKNEAVLISFKLVKSGKVATVAISQKKPTYIIYRFGRKNRIEMEYPGKNPDSWRKFSYSYYFRGGGPGNFGLDLNYLRFSNRNYTYTIYEEYSAETQDYEVGIRIKNKQTPREVVLKGDYSSLIGSLVDLRFDKRIKVKDGGNSDE